MVATTLTLAAVTLRETAAGSTPTKAARCSAKLAASKVSTVSANVATKLTSVNNAPPGESGGSGEGDGGDGLGGGGDGDGGEGLGGGGDGDGGDGLGGGGDGDGGDGLGGDGDGGGDAETHTRIWSTFAPELLIEAIRMVLLPSVSVAEMDEVRVHVDQLPEAGNASS